MGRNSKAVLALVVLFLLAGSAWAATLDFEDLCPPGYETIGALPNPYHGFVLTGYAPWWMTRNFLVPSGYQNTINGHVGIYTWNEQKISFWRAQTFDVASVRIGAAWNDNQGVRIQGLLGGVLKYNVYTVLSYDGGNLALDFANIDTFTINPEGTGTDHNPNDRGVGRTVVVDDINLDIGTPTEPPEANAGPDQTVEQASAAGTQVTLDGSASTGEAPLTFAWHEGAALLGTGPAIAPTLQLGAHTITLVVTDGNGQSDSDDCVVTVQDTMRPTLGLTILKPTLWPVNHQLLLAAAVSGVTDMCDAQPAVAIEVTSNETISGPGTASPDWMVVQNGGVRQIWLRAERTGAGDGRTYTITATATDASGNSRVATGTVIVPHDQRK